MLILFRVYLYHSVLDLCGKNETTRLRPYKPRTFSQ